MPNERGAETVMPPVLVCLGEHADAAQVARVMSSDDKVTPQFIQRAATAPADTTTSGWATDLATVSQYRAALYGSCIL